MSREIEGMWEIRDATGEVLATGATEGQAWIQMHFDWLRSRVGQMNGWLLLGWVRGQKDAGVRAVEVR